MKYLRPIYFQRRNMPVSMGYSKIDVTPVLTHWSCVSFALTHRYDSILIKCSKKLVGSVRARKSFGLSRERHLMNHIMHCTMMADAACMSVLRHNDNSLDQDCSISIANSLAPLQSCAKPSMCDHTGTIKQCGAQWFEENIEHIWILYYCIALRLSR